MNRIQLTQRVRSLTRDLSNSVFREQDIIDYLNEGIERVIQVIPECVNMVILANTTDEPTHLPNAYHSLLALYSASRCFSQDERHYQASTFMNEFEIKLTELKTLIENGIISIIDPVTNSIISASDNIDYVQDNYFESRISTVDLDDGVEGVE